MEEPWRWEFPVGLALGGIVVLSILVVALIVILSNLAPVCTTFTYDP